MKGFSYRERDYAFGQLMLTVRTKLALTQTEVVEGLGVGCRAAAWSPDGRLQASGSLDQMIWLWEVERSSSR
ncbi:MAG TPA: hypothetical protein VFN02_07235, partial [Ktedonobacteraceae bacterium]|nr:hypothetical protein [Ktedonobacteraceae bacterium]